MTWMEWAHNLHGFVMQHLFFNFISFRTSAQAIDASSVKDKALYLPLGGESEEISW